MVRFVVSLTALLVLSREVSALDFPPPGHGPGGPGRSPGMQMDDITKIKFEYKKEDNIFKDEAEAIVFQALYEKNKEAKVVTDFFSSLETARKKKMDDERSKGERPDFEKMKSERALEKVSMLKDLKALLEKMLPKKEHDACGEGKTPAVLEKVTTDSMKDAAKAAKLVMSEEELAKIKKDLKEEVKKELMAEMAKNKPREESPDKFRGGPPERNQERNQERPPEKRMAGGGGSPPRGGSMSMNMNMGQQNSGAMGQQMEMMNQNSYGVQFMNFPSQTMGQQNNGMQMGGQQMGMGQMQMGQQQNRRMRPQYSMGMNQMQNSQLNYGQNVNYNNTNMMYGQSNMMFNPYGQQQQQTNPFNAYNAYNSFQYPMMTMGN